MRGGRGVRCVPFSGLPVSSDYTIWENAMKSPLPTLCMIVIGVVAIGMMMTAPLSAKDSTEAMIEVSATAERRVMADRAEFTFTVQGLGPSLGQAVESATRATDSIVTKLIALGIGKGRISTQHFTSGENRGDKAFLSSSRDYKARITTRITVDSLPLLASAVALVSEADVDDVGSIDFSLRDETSLLRELRKEAARTARQKAEDITSELGAKIGRVLFADESGSKSYRNEYGNATRGVVNSVVRTPGITVSSQGFVAQASFNAPEMMLTARISVRFQVHE